METAFVLIHTRPGNEEKVTHRLRKVKGVKEAYIVLGEYDVIAKIQALTREGINNLVTQRIRKIKGIRNLHVSLVIDLESPYL